jgi:hypothetical protein
MSGIKESKELLKGLFALATVSADLLKDGFQVSDLVAGFQVIEGDPVKKAALEEALKGIGEIPAELKDVSMVQDLPALLAAFKKA